MARHVRSRATRRLAATVLGLSLASCGGVGQQDWYYHWNCHGDYECLTTNAWDQPAGVADEGPVESDCTSLMTFAAHNWSAPATNSCDHASTGPRVVSLAVVPGTASIAKGRSQPFAAKATWDDGYTEDVTGGAAWSTSDGSVAHLMGSTAFGDAAGTTVVTATVGGASASATLTVTAAALQSISVSPIAARAPKGSTQQFTATGHYSDGSSQDLTGAATWTSSVPAFATIDAAGLATAVAPGSTMIAAAHGGLTGSTSFTVGAAQLVSIAVTPATPTLPLGVTQQLTATGTYTDGSQANLTAQVAWTSGTPATAAVSGGGLVTPVAPGTTPVTATLGAVSGSTVVTVTAAALQSIAVSPAAVSLPVGFTQPFTATGHYTDGTSADLTAGATWTTGNPAAATVSAGGVATTVAAGGATITATVGGVIGSGTLTVTSATLTAITVTPANPSILTNGTQQFAATGTYSDASVHDVTALATWGSSSPAVATVAAGGLASGLANGTTTISARVGTVAGSTSLTVLLPGSIWTLRAGVTSTINALSAVASSGSLFAAVGVGTIMTSPDGVAWASVPYVDPYYLLGITWTGGQFDAVGYYNTYAEPLSLYSSDGASWTGYGWTPSNPFPWAIAWTHLGGVAVGAGGALWNAPSVQYFALRSSGTGANLYAAADSGSVVVVVGAGGTVLTSTDASTFTARASGTSADLNGVAWTGSRFVAVGAGGTVLTSPDGIAWTSRASGTTAALNAVATSGALVVAVGDGATAIASPDGIAWSPATVPGNLTANDKNLYGVAWSGSRFVAVGGRAHGLVLSSP